jgi:hypothetical protein
MATKIINRDNEYKKIVIVTREVLELAPGEEIEFDGDVELV